MTLSQVLGLALLCTNAPEDETAFLITYVIQPILLVVNLMILISIIVDLEIYKQLVSTSFVSALYTFFLRLSTALLPRRHHILPRYLSDFPANEPFNAARY